MIISSISGLVTALADTSYGIGLMVGPAVGGGLHQVGGYLLPFLVEGGVSLVLCIVVFCMGKEAAREEVADNADVTQVTWKKVLMAPTIMLREGSGHSFTREKLFVVIDAQMYSTLYCRSAL